MAKRFTRQEIQEMMKRKKNVSTNSHMTVFHSTKKEKKCAIIVSSKIFKTKVKRNYIKRRVRECIKTLRIENNTLIIVKKQIQTLKKKDICVTVKSLVSTSTQTL